MTDTTDPQTDPAERLESIRRALAAVAADRPTPEQIAGWNTADREMAQRIRAALPGVPLHHAYAVLQALRVTQRLDAAAAQPPAADRGAAERLSRVLEWVTGEVVSAKTEFGDGYRAAQRDIRDLVKGRFDYDPRPATPPAVVAEPGKENSRG